MDGVGVGVVKSGIVGDESVVGTSSRNLEKKEGTRPNFTRNVPGKPVARFE